MFAEPREIWFGPLVRLIQSWTLKFSSRLKTGANARITSPSTRISVSLKHVLGTNWLLWLACKRTWVLSGNSCSRVWARHFHHEPLSPNKMSSPAGRLLWSSGGQSVDSLLSCVLEWDSLRWWPGQGIKEHVTLTLLDLTTSSFVASSPYN